MEEGQQIRREDKRNIETREERRQRNITE